MRKLLYDAISYVLEHGNAFNRLKLAHIMGKKRDYQPLVDNLLSMQNEDGGWPWQLEAGSPSGVSDTAKVLELLAEVGLERTSSPIRKAASYLLDLQNEDGGWSESRELEGMIPREWTWISTKHSGYQTADAVNALSQAGYKGDEVWRAIDFLKASQNEEGGWHSHIGSDPNQVTDVATTDHILRALLRNGEPRESQTIKRAEEMLMGKIGETDSPVNTASVLCALKLLGYTGEDERFSQMVGWLVDHQRPDGGWNWFGELPSNPSQTVDCLEQLADFVDMEPS
ncbi:MAG: terpene cyclase/mutase family protein [Candidatus Bathyarchaeota archaeon]|nr:MAG: terpene cyclase/mutase family protein [Candidatus Bathyarchaeota archaeon]